MGQLLERQVYHRVDNQANATRSDDDPMWYQMRRLLADCFWSTIQPVSVKPFSVLCL